MVVNYYDGRPQNHWGDRAENALSDFVRSGKGLVLYHLALGAFDGWGDYENMSGGNWRPNNGHHSAQHDYAVDIKDTEHPITHGLKSPLMIQQDELFANLKWQPEGAFHILATAWDDDALYNGKSAQPILGTRHRSTHTVDHRIRTRPRLCHRSRSRCERCRSIAFQSGIGTRRRVGCHRKVTLFVLDELAAR
jgi:hypothetical protein